MWRHNTALISELRRERQCCCPLPARGGRPQGSPTHGAQGGGWGRGRLSEQPDFFFGPKPYNLSSFLISQRFPSHASAICRRCRKSVARARPHSPVSAAFRLTTHTSGGGFVPSRLAQCICGLMEMAGHRAGAPRELAMPPVLGAACIATLRQRMQKHRRPRRRLSRCHQPRLRCRRHECGLRLASKGVEKRRGAGESDMCA